MMKNKKINFDEAKEAHIAYNPGFSNTFNEYSPAYVVTNEDLRPIIKSQPIKHSRILTVAGSGDSPLFHSIAGASRVDTFDASFCAKAIMDIKTTALSVLDYPEYIKLLNNLYKASRISLVPSMSKILPNLPDDTHEFLKEMDTNIIFRNGLHPSNYTKYFPTEQEYSKMKNTVKKPFKFIWSDIAQLHKNLNSKYDIMNFSNIFQYIEDPGKITSILNSLEPYLSPNGTIVAHTTWYFRPFEMEKYVKVQKAVKTWANLWISKSKVQESIIMIKHR